jgi:hypothetical protein
VIVFWCGVLMETLFVVYVDMLMRVEIISFLSVALARGSGNLVCKGVLVCLVCLTGRLC